MMHRCFQGLAIGFLWVLLSIVSVGGAMSEDEITPGGSRVLRYEGYEYEFRAPEGEGRNLDEITDFLEGFLGENTGVFRETESDKVRIDVLYFPPRPGQEWWTLVTSGMSDLPMTVPDGLENPEGVELAELVLLLPKDWFVADEKGLVAADVMEDQQKFWPVEMLQWLARFPHEYESWVWYGHSFPNGDPAEPYSSNTKLSNALLLVPVHWQPEQYNMKLKNGRDLTFLSVVFLYDDERDVKLQQGTDVLTDAFDRAGVTELLDISRPSAVRTKNVLDFLRGLSKK